MTTSTIREDRVAGGIGRLRRELDHYPEELPVMARAVNTSSHGASESTMTCKCGADHDVAIPDLELGEDHAGSLPRGRTYQNRKGKMIFLYPNSRAPSRAARGSCSCGSVEDGAECTCVPYRMAGEYGVTVRGKLPPWYPLREAT